MLANRASRRSRMHEKRTFTSGWAYRIALGASVALTLWAARFAYGLIKDASPAPLGAAMDMGLLLPVVISVGGPVVLMAALALALGLRSGAALWVMWLLLITEALPVPLSILQPQGAGAPLAAGGFAAGMVFALILIGGLLTLLFTYLIRRGELRAA